MKADDTCEVIITAPDAEWLEAFTRQLVVDQLAACGHHMAIRSVYRWEGEIYEKPEGRVALHTRRDLVDAIIARTTRDHPYEVPCVIATPVIDGNPHYLDWVRTETAAST